MANVKLLKRTAKLNKLFSDLKEMDKSKVEVGHFQEQGVHQGSGFTYADLMAYHHFGDPEKNIPARPIRSIVTHNAERTLKDRSLKAKLVNWGKAKDRENAIRGVLDTIGELLVGSGKAVFGNRQLLTPNTSKVAKAKGGNTPMVESGELEKHYAYKTSKDKVVKET